MSDLKQACIMLETAGRDIAALRGMGNAVVFADEIFGFHVQQATEKLFKAWLSLLGETYPPTHDLSWLLEKLTIRQPEAVHFDALVEYTPYAVQFRYGITDIGIEPLDRGKFEKLLDKGVGEIGAVAGPLRAPWKARRGAVVKLIEAKASAIY